MVGLKHLKAFKNTADASVSTTKLVSVAEKSIVDLIDCAAIKPMKEPILSRLLSSVERYSNPGYTPIDWLRLRATAIKTGDVRKLSKSARFLPDIAKAVYYSRHPRDIGEWLATAICGQDWKAVAVIAQHTDSDSFQTAINCIELSQLPFVLESLACCKDKSLLAFFVKRLSVDHLRSCFNNPASDIHLLAILKGAETEVEILALLLQKLGVAYLNEKRWGSANHSLLSKAMDITYPSSVLARLLDLGLNPNTLSGDDLSAPLHRLDGGNHNCLYEMTLSAQEKAKLLLDAGADINVTDAAGRTPLHIAILKLKEGGYDDLGRAPGATAPVLEYLLAKGASPFQKSASGWNAYDYACNAEWYHQTAATDWNGLDPWMTGHEIARLNLEPYSVLEKQFLREVANSEFYPFVDHLHGRHDLSISDVKAIVKGTAIETRHDWQEYLVYELLFGGSVRHMGGVKLGASEAGDTNPLNSTSSERLVFHTLKQIERYVNELDNSLDD